MFATQLGTIAAISVSWLECLAPARAVPLLPSQTVTTPGTPYPVSGATLVNTQDLPYAGPGSFGTLWVEVFRENASGTLDLATNSSSIPAFGLQHSLPVDGWWQRIKYSFTGAGLTPGATSDAFYVTTNATHYHTFGSVLVNGATVGTAPVGGVFEPSGSPRIAPEPSPATVVVICGVCMAGFGWRRMLGRRREQFKGLLQSASRLWRRRSHGAVDSGVSPARSGAEPVGKRTGLSTLLGGLPSAGIVLAAGSSPSLRSRVMTGRQSRSRL